MGADDSKFRGSQKEWPTGLIQLSYLVLVIRLVVVVYVKLFQF